MLEGSHPMGAMNIVISKVLAMCSLHGRCEGGPESKKRLESRCLSATEVTASRSGLSSHHCRWSSVLPALLPAWAGSRVTTCQAACAYAQASLQTTCLVGASHPHGKQDMRQSTTLHQPSPYTGHREA